MAIPRSDLLGSLVSALVNSLLFFLVISLMVVLAPNAFLDGGPAWVSTPARTARLRRQPPPSGELQVELHGAREIGDGAYRLATDQRFSVTVRHQGDGTHETRLLIRARLESSSLPLGSHRPDVTILLDGRRYDRKRGIFHYDASLDRILPPDPSLWRLEILVIDPLVCGEDDDRVHDCAVTERWLQLTRGTS